MIRDNLSAAVPEAIRQSVGQFLGTAPDDGPAHGMGQGGQDHAERRRCRLFKGNHGVGGQAGEERPCPIALKLCFREVLEGTQTRGRQNGPSGADLPESGEVSGYRQRVCS